MKVYDTKNIRNVAFAGHTHAGKTSLTEALLYTTKSIERLGRIEEGNTISDHDPEEIRRGISIQSSVLPLEFEDCKINVLDSPGSRDFVGEIKGVLHISGGMVDVIDATGGVETGTEDAWCWSSEFQLPKVVFINKMDKENASYERCLEAVRTTLEARLIPLTLPVGAGADFKGVIDLIRMKFVEEEQQKVSYKEIPDEMKDAALEARAALVEAAAEGDEELLEKFLTEENLSSAEVLRGLLEDVVERRIVPVLCGSATQLKGLRPLVEFIAHCMPDPSYNHSCEYVEKEGDEPKWFQVTDEGTPVVYVFKTLTDPYAGKLSYFKVLRGRLKTDNTLTNVQQSKDERLSHILVPIGKKTVEVGELAAGDIGCVAKLDNTHTGDTLVQPGNGMLWITKVPLPSRTVFRALTPKSRADEDKVAMGLHKLIEQDPTLHFARNPETKENVLSGMGEIHLDVAIAELKLIGHVEVETSVPRVPYRETITKPGQGQGKHKKQSGGHGQYGDCWVKFEPLPEGSGFQFVWAIVGGVIPTNYQSAVEKGLQESMARGVLSGHPTVDFKATCYDGSYHSVDSSDMAFKVAASLAFRNVIPNCGPVLLEPIYKATITLPDEYMGDVMGDLNSRRGRILGMNSEGRKQIIEAHVPLSELYTYTRHLNAVTHGRGMFEMAFDHYEQIPNSVKDQIIEECKRLRQEGELVGAH